uniref:interleukin-5 receptor subunit alpha-like n=1 Tax=Pristiophorus japonicus TaxID=55135 RepID=UPI00398E575D
MFLLAAYLTISFVLPIVLSGSPEFLANLTDLNPPTNLQTIDIQLGELTITWSDNLSEDIKNHYNVKYIFDYKYFDSHTWEIDIRLSTPDYTKTFELHRGVYVRVKNVLLNIEDKKKQMKESNWTVKGIQPPPGDPETLVSNFSCVVYNHSNMNCTWSIGSKAPSDTLYIMYYRQSETTTRCAQYFMDAQGRHGCHIEQDRIDLEEDVLVCVNGSSNSTMILPYYTDFDPQIYEKYDPPLNVEILPNLTVKWDKAPGYAIQDDCFEYQLEVRELAENRIELLSASGKTKFLLGNINPSKRYSVKVRVKLKYCKETKFWSDWSNEDFIEPEHTFNVMQTVFTLAMITVLVILLLMFAFRRYKVLAIIFKPIPDPQKKFKELFEEYNGDFQKWIGYQIPISKADEFYPVVIEESINFEA